MTVAESLSVKTAGTTVPSLIAALLIDAAHDHDLHGGTLNGLKRQMGVIACGGGSPFDTGRTRELADGMRAVGLTL